jgi:GNAT superfamily N-acetyltransferase
MDNIRIEKIDPVACYDQLYELYQKIWPRSWGADRNLFYWRTITAAKSPLTKTTAYVAMGMDSIMRGLICGIPGAVSIDGQKLAITWPVDLALEKALRGKGIGKKLVLHMFENEPNVIWMGGTQNFLSVANSLGWTKQNNVKSYIKVLKPINYFFHKKNKNRNHLEIMFRSIGTLCKEKSKSVNAQGIRKAEDISFSPEEIVEKYGPKNAVLTLRPRDLIMWQCEKAPFSECNYFVLEKKGHMDGYMILRIHRTKEGVTEGRILDIFSRDLNKDNLKLMIAYAVMVFRKKNVVQVRLLAAHPHLKMACLELDFHESQGPNLIYPPALSQGIDKADWHLTMLDSDYAYR